MPEFQRAQVASLCRRLRPSHFRLSMVFGPRQSGKTTITKQAIRQLNVANRFVAVDDSRSITVRSASPGPSAGASVSCHPWVANSDRMVKAWVQARHDANRFGEFVLVLDGIRNIPD